MVTAATPESPSVIVTSPTVMFGPSSADAGRTGASTPKTTKTASPQRTNAARIPGPPAVHRCQLLGDYKFLCPVQVNADSTGTPRRLREAAHGDIQHESDGDERRDDGRTAVGHERQWDARDRHDAHGHTHVLEDLDREHREHADCDERSEEVGRQQGYSPEAPRQERVEQQQRRAADEAEVLPHRREDEVGVLLGNEAVLRLHATAEAGAVEVT